ncbi:glutamate--cysteine ligase [Streptomyces thermolineatus]|uniref:carboxylate-amine ligase n=1 Tax=Streptomyces thermolineatus TaxID=44033 RepID=UPI0031D1283A
MTTVGVEEEYLLLDPATGLPVARAEEVRTAAGLRHGTGPDEVQSELLQAQLEVATPVCRTLDEVAAHLLRLRGAVGAAAERAGCRVATCGAAPLAGPEPVPVTDAPRYRALSLRAPQLVREQLINGMHVHVAVPDREAGVGVLNRLRPWLPVLVAMAANSPLWQGIDTGFASWRTVVFGRWPVGGPPPLFAGAADYERRVRDLLATGTLMDRGQLYWQARLSERYPTVEVRAPDVQLLPEDAVAFAGLVRALVVTALAGEAEGAPFPAPSEELLAAANWQASRYGLSGRLLDPLGRSLGAGEAVRGLLEHVGPALDRAGDSGRVLLLAHRLLHGGTAAERQRRALAEGGPGALVGLVTGGTGPPGPGPAAGGPGPGGGRSRASERSCAP